MIRMGLSFIASFVLFYFESLIVMKLFHYENGISFDNYTQVVVVCILNFFIIFSILTQLTPWFLRVNKINLEEE